MSLPPPGDRTDTGPQPDPASARGRLRLLAWLVVVLAVVAGAVVTTRPVAAAGPSSASPTSTTLSCPTAVVLAVVVVRAPSPASTTLARNRVTAIFAGAAKGGGAVAQTVPDRVGENGLQLRQVAYGVTVYVNGDPVNLSDPTGHDPVGSYSRDDALYGTGVTRGSVGAIIAASLRLSQTPTVTLVCLGNSYDPAHCAHGVHPLTPGLDYTCKRSAFLTCIPVATIQGSSPDETYDQFLNDSIVSNTAASLKRLADDGGFVLDSGGALRIRVKALSNLWRNGETHEIRSAASQLVRDLGGSTKWAASDTFEALAKRAPIVGLLVGGVDDLAQGHSLERTISEEAGAGAGLYGGAALGTLGCAAIGAPSAEVGGVACVALIAGGSAAGGFFGHWAGGELDALWHKVKG